MKWVLDNPELNNVALVPSSYSVVSKGGENTAATVAVQLKLTADDQVWDTKARGTDQERVGEQALVDGYKYYILKRRMLEQ